MPANGPEIYVREGLWAIRARPGMYCGSGSVLTAVLEASLCLALDAVASGGADAIVLTVNGPHEMSVRHEGSFPWLVKPPGTECPAPTILFDRSLTLAELVMTSMWACRGLKGDGERHLCRTSLPVATALSSRCSITVVAGGVAWRADYRDGVVEEPLRIGETADRIHDSVMLAFTFDPLFLAGEVIDDRILDAVVQAARTHIPGVNLSIRSARSGPPSAP